MIGVDAAGALHPVIVDTAGNIGISSGSGTFNENLTQVGGAAVALGQSTMAAALPVAIASNQSTVRIDPTGTTTQPVSGNVGVTGTPNVNLSQVGGTSVAVGPPTDGSVASTSSIPVVNYNKLLNGATWDNARTPNIFKTGTATANGNTTLWTPASGKKFRLMGIVVVAVTGQSTQTVGGNFEITLTDSGTAIGLGWSLLVPSVALANVSDTIFPAADLKNGYLSTTANNVLQVNLSAGMVAGECRVTVYGTEE
jgi:hypothetical protein